MDDGLEQLRRQVIQALKDCSDNCRGMSVAEIARAIRADEQLVLVILYDLRPDIQMRYGSALFPGETDKPNNPVETTAEQMLHYYRLSPRK